MAEEHVQWLTYHFNIEYMFHIALEQLHHIDNNDENDFDDSILTDCSIFSNTIEKTTQTKFRYLFHLTIYLWTLLFLWLIFQISTIPFYSQ